MRNSYPQELSTGKAKPVDDTPNALKLSTTG
jgi:hypothetical protein